VRQVHPAAGVDTLEQCLGPGPVFIQVVEGEVTFYEADDPDCKPTLVKKGESYLVAETGRVRNAAGPEERHEESERVDPLRPGRLLVEDLAVLLAVGLDHGELLWCRLAPAAEPLLLPDELSACSPECQPTAPPRDTSCTSARTRRGTGRCARPRARRQSRARLDPASC
jgi:hypothetical protein